MRKAPVRRERLAQALRQELSELLLHGSKDPRLAGVVVTAVDMSGDLKQATAYFSVVGDAERERQATDALRQAAGFLRREVGRRMRLHDAPHLEFRRDLGFERADRVLRALDRVRAETPPEASEDE